MRDLEERLHEADGLTPPDLWSDVKQRSQTPAPRRGRVGTIVFALAVSGAAVGVLMVTFAHLAGEKPPGPATRQPTVDVWTLGPGAPISPPAGTSALTSTTSELTPALPGVAFAFGDVWVLGYSQIARVDSQSGQPKATIEFGADDNAMAAAAGHHLWVSNGVKELIEIDPESNSVVGTLEMGDLIEGLAEFDGSLWVSLASGSLVEVDTSSGNIGRELSPGIDGLLSVAGNGLWIQADSTATRIDTDSGDVMTEVEDAEAPVVEAGLLFWSITVGGDPAGIKRTVVGFDPQTGKGVVSFALPRAFELAAGPEGLWVFALGNASHPAMVYLVDPEADSVVGQVAVNGAPATVVAGAGDLWIAHFETGILTRVMNARP